MKGFVFPFQPAAQARMLGAIEVEHGVLMQFAGCQDTVRAAQWKCAEKALA